MGRAKSGSANARNDASVAILIIGAVVVMGLFAVFYPLFIGSRALSSMEQARIAEMEETLRRAQSGDIVIYHDSRASDLVAGLDEEQDVLWLCSGGRQRIPDLAREVKRVVAPPPGGTRSAPCVAVPD